MRISDWSSDVCSSDLLRLGILPLYAAQRLFPRLADLRAKHPDLHLDIDTAGHTVARLGAGLDVAIALPREIDPALYAKRLDLNRVYAIGARALVEGPRSEAHTSGLQSIMRISYTVLCLKKNTSY